MVLSERINHNQEKVDSGATKAKSFHAFLSPERQQKYELILSLIKTQQQSLIVCGPQGIGKTTILKQLAQSKNRRQLWNYVECEGALTVSKIITHLSSVLSIRAERHSNKEDTNLAKTLARQLSKIAKNGNTVMLVLDDVGALHAGVITKLFAFARQCKGLQLVLSLTPDALFIKRSTDYVIDESYVVEVPPLTASETEAFVLDYIRQNDSTSLIDKIEQSIAEEMYHKSQGIPGVVISELKNLDTPLPTKSGDIKPGSLIWFAVLGLIGILIWAGLSYIGKISHEQSNQRYVDLDNSPPASVGLQTPLKQTDETNVIANLSKQKTIAVVPTTEDILNATLVKDFSSLTNERMLIPPVTESETSELETIGISNNSSPALAIDKGSGQHKPINVSPGNLAQSELNRKKAIQKPRFEKIHGPEWILAQDKGSYTLQLMATHEKNVLQDYINKITELHHQAAYYQMKRNGKNWYGLVYGIYPSPATAKRASKGLPKFLGKPYMQQLNTVQSRIRDFK